MIFLFVAQDMIWSPKNKRPEKLKDGLKEVEVKLITGSNISLQI